MERYACSFPGTHRIQGQAVGREACVVKRKDAVGQTLAVSAVLLAALFLLPMAVVAPFAPEAAPESERVELSVQKQPIVGGSRDREVRLRVLHEGEVIEMDLGTYLMGVVRAEMPASFEPEALKAQAVAARTYTLYKLSAGGNHGDGVDICTNHACCQAWRDEETAAGNWGDEREAFQEKVERAVRETDGLVVLYEGEPILAVFHSSSAGLTRAAEDVWLSDVPYLQPVSSPEDGAAIPDYYSRVEISTEEFCRLAKQRYPEADLSGEPDTWLKNAVTDAKGSVVTVSLGGETVKGGEMRALLGLRSACFTWEAEPDRLIFFVTGYGHGVGMSQYGAEAMAAEGADFREILTHYYTGAVVGYRVG